MYKCTLRQCVVKLKLLIHNYSMHDSSNPIRQKSYNFAIEIILLQKRLASEREFIISKQLLRSGTSIGANVEEAHQAHSRKDFLSKMQIALFHYWAILDTSHGILRRNIFNM